MEENAHIQALIGNALELLQKLIAIPSMSKEEHKTADTIQAFLSEKNIPTQRIKNNVWSVNRYFDPSKQTLLLNSHHDTVPPNRSYTLDPHTAEIRDGKLFGLGSNDAGGALVSLLATFLYYYSRPLPFNIVFAASAEEEISGKDGIELLLPHLPQIDMGIVGEPTRMQMATAEKGLLVLDCIAAGTPGHAARDEGENALYKAINDIQWLRNFSFPKVSDLSGPVHIATTVIETKNKSHNVVPAECHFVVDVRVNELYTFEEILEEFKTHMQSETHPRSFRLKPSSIDKDHPLVTSGSALGMESYGSPTSSDMGFMNFPAVKCGPGNSSRSHSADEFIFLEEIEGGIKKYIQWLSQLEKIFKKESL